MHTSSKLIAPLKLILINLKLEIWYHSNLTGLRSLCPMTNNSQHQWHLLNGFCLFALVFRSVTRLHTREYCTLSPTTTIYSIFFIHFHFFNFLLLILDPFLFFLFFSRSQDGHYYSLAWIMEFVAIVIFTIYINIGKREMKTNEMISI